jgi:hypothetical protein
VSAAASTGIRPEFGFTRHAVRRFIERVQATTDHRDALRILADVADQAVLLPRRTRFGQAIWRVESPAMRWITKPDGGVTVVVTILDGSTGGEDEAEQEVLDAHKRLASIAPDLVTATRPTARPRCCAGHAAGWLELETKRLDVERRRIEAIAAADANAAKAVEAKRNAERAKQERAKAEAQRQQAAAAIHKAKAVAASAREAKSKTLRQRTSLLRDAAERLRKIDAEASADLLERIGKVLLAEQSADAGWGTK